MHHRESFQVSYMKIAESHIASVPKISTMVVVYFFGKYPFMGIWGTLQGFLKYRFE